jgi:hypothetical protein
VCVCCVQDKEYSKYTCRLEGFDTTISQAIERFEPLETTQPSPRSKWTLAELDKIGSPKCPKKTAWTAYLDGNGRKSAIDAIGDLTKTIEDAIQALNEHSTSAGVDDSGEGESADEPQANDTGVDTPVAKKQRLIVRAT